MATQPLKLPSENPDATRARLIEAASQVFAEHGYQATTVREICSRAGANVAAVNYHFRDKAGLYLAAVRHLMDCSGEQVPAEAAETADSPEEALKIMIAALVRRISFSAGGHLRIMLHEITQPTDALPSMVDEVVRPNHEALRTIVGKQLGKDRDDETTRLCSHSIIAQIIHFIHGRPVIDLLWPDLKKMPNQMDRIAEHVWQFSLQAIKHLGEVNSHE